MKKERTELKKEVRFLKSKKHENQVIVKKLTERGYTTTQVKSIVLNNSGQRNYCRKDIVFGAVLRSISKRAYKFVSKKKLISCPSSRTVDRWLKNFKVRPGLQEDLIKILTVKYTEEKDKEAALSFDEMALKPRWTYDKVFSFQTVLVSYVNSSFLFLNFFLSEDTESDDPCF